MKQKYNVYLPKDDLQLIDFFQRIAKKRPVKHYIIRVKNVYISLLELISILNNNKENITKFRKNKSLVLWLESDFDQIPDFIPVAPTEEEALDIIDFEEIEKDLMF